GCPDKSTIKKGACSALIKNPELARHIIEATIKGAGGLPVSVKTRIGFGTPDTENWVTTLLQTPIAALILHLRTVKEMSKPPAHWDQLKSATVIRENLKSKTLIIGNGDVKSLKDARGKCQEYGIDGVMIGRGIFENPWIFNEEKDIEKVPPQERIDLFIKHLNLYKTIWGDTKNFENMKKFVKCYVKGFREASEIRERLMRTKSLDELIEETCLISLNSDKI
ncbi:MAG: tRNA-dihydrouridine synthase, partial [Candidatus Daviesbacteria bacterium]|nr:tRNA-dihydrouridine synthase [Candidatus Daviesbacteria bacterium]